MRRWRLVRVVKVVDTTVPVRSRLSGSSTVTHEAKGVPYVDAGARATDTLDGRFNGIR